MLLTWPFFKLFTGKHVVRSIIQQKTAQLTSYQTQVTEVLRVQTLQFRIVCDLRLATKFNCEPASFNSPVSNSSRPLNRSTEDSYIRGQPRPKVNIFTNSSQKKTCVQLCLLFLLLKFSHLLTGIFESVLPQVEANLFALSFSGHDEFKTGLLTRRSWHSTYPFQMKKLSGKTY